MSFCSWPTQSPIHFHFIKKTSQDVLQKFLLSSTKVAWISNDMRVNYWFLLIEYFGWILIWKSFTLMSLSSTATKESLHHWCHVTMNDTHFHTIALVSARASCWIQHNRWPDTSLPMEPLNGAVFQLTSFISASLT